MNIQNGEITPAPGNTASPPTSNVTSDTALAPSGITILTAASGAGTGTFNFPPHFKLLVPGNTVAGAYNTTVTATIIAGP
ncbi:MAG: hypothetical protein HY784_09255 [Chloroflexi bacterium]|nr:hypothetical protein [Chloroflexota bacterium]